MIKTRSSSFGPVIVTEKEMVEEDGEEGVIQAFPKGSDAGQETEEVHNAVEVVRIPSQADLPAVDGHRLRPNEWAAFEEFCLTSNIGRAAARAGVSGWTIWKWRKSQWWESLHENHVKAHQRAFEAKLATFSDALLRGLVAVAKGEDKADKTASARVRACEIFMRSGDKPLITQKPNVQITTTNQIMNVPVGESIAKNWTQDQLNEYARTGKKPEPKGN